MESEWSRDQRKQPGRDLAARAHSLSEWLSGPSLVCRGPPFLMTAAGA